MMSDFNSLQEKDGDAMRCKSLHGRVQNIVPRQNWTFELSRLLVDIDFAMQLARTSFLLVVGCS